MSAAVRLEPQTLAEIRAMVAAMSPEERSQLSASWLAELAQAETADVWVHGFHVVHASDGRVGNCGFTGPPDETGRVEIAYRIDEGRRSRGFATAAAQALMEFGAASGRVRGFCAHTLAEENASTTILRKCGFRFVEEFEHPTDGRIWRWERTLA